MSSIARKVKIRDSLEDRLLYGIVGTILAIVTVVFSYPLIFVISSSFSSAQAVTNGRVFLWPVDLSIEGYRAVFSHQSIMLGYRNTLFYTLVGTLINVSMTMLCAYPLSRKDLPLRGFFTFLFVLTMFFAAA